MKLTVHPPFPERPTAHGPSRRTRHPQADGCQEERGFGKLGDVDYGPIGLLYGAFFGLVAAAFLIAVLG